MKKNVIKKIFHILDEFVYYCVLFPILVISVVIVYKSLKYPEKIPDAFGYELFIILDEYMDDFLDFGDLVITKKIPSQNLNVGDVIAFRNDDNIVTIHKISAKEQEIQKNKETDEEKQTIMFTMQTSKNETLDTKYVSEEKVEGIVVKKISKLGYIILLIQEPKFLALIIIIILIIGLIVYYIAQQLDFKDMRKMQELEKLEQNNKEEKNT